MRRPGGVRPAGEHRQELDRHPDQCCAAPPSSGRRPRRFVQPPRSAQRRPTSRRPRQHLRGVVRSALAGPPAPEASVPGQHRAVRPTSSHKARSRPVTVACRRLALFTLAVVLTCLFADSSRRTTSKEHSHRIEPCRATALTVTVRTEAAFLRPYGRAQARKTLPANATLRRRVASFTSPGIVPTLSQPSDGPLAPCRCELQGGAGARPYLPGQGHRHPRPL